MKRAHHPFLEPVNPGISERMSDADPVRQAVVELGDHSLVHIPPQGSIPHQLSQARSEGTAATRDAQAYNSYGASRNGPHERSELLSNGASPRQDRLESYAQDLYG